MTSYIECKNIVKKLKGNHVLDDISFSIKENEFVVLRGHNGSGKTMILRAIAGLLTLTKGEVSVNGLVIGKDIDFSEHTGLLIEYPSFIPVYSGFQNLKFLASIKKKVSDEEIKEVIRKVGLDPEDKRKVKRYSLGMKQRLGIAQAIMEKPKLLLLDEPTNALDKKGINLILDILKTEKENGTTIVVASHDDTLCENSVVDRIIDISEGKLEDTDE
ncbi:MULTISPECIES: ABC transporter ATP-binding protein [Bacillus]|jgi:ABC-2 type transport system ATP-binding protein|uniref:ABC transporter ATP-binding protein n=1 Tax=Bacillus TaxID=1386 RepID=UPI0001F5B2E4|nr:MULTISPECIES: ABC transporter ATP-binding protein [Bacillus]AOL31486.1 multidrug ABC transporter ATP-binding protein [Alkalicoccobacillus gibsonii]MBW4825475.1 ABC transporter ATP-binding protein [Bacillaceae bacterium]ADV94563.1 bacitracin transporter ATP-binding protein BcrA [Bacillus subtilis BSn5]AID00051.1 multidrug ABC transporter ATP-binding protein [Bacillus subtilis subsp. subtilis str. OH 131.1]AIX09382.1 putative ABC transporter ATP-binding protein YxlF [Bacillus subtilis]